MNHQSYLDPPLAGVASGREVYFLARKTLLDLPVLRWLLPKLNVVPVDQEGNDRSALKTLLRILKAGEGDGGFSRRRAHARRQSPTRAARIGIHHRERHALLSCRCEFSVLMKPGRAALAVCGYVP